MPQAASADLSARPAKDRRIRSYAGALDALANFHFTAIELAEKGGPGVASQCLSESGDVALHNLLKPYNVTNSFGVEGTFEDGFTFALKVAAALTWAPFNPEASLRRFIAELVTMLHERREDENARYEVLG